MSITRLLLAVITCEKYKDRADIQRRTWAKDAGDIDVRFFVGRDAGLEWGVIDEIGDTVCLDVKDGYDSLPIKVREMFRWAADAGYDYILKTDDDTLVIPDNFRDVVKGDYTGCNNGSDPQYCSGFGYVLSNRAARVVADSDWDGDWAEDRWVGKCLRQAGIGITDNDLFVFANHWPPRCREHRRFGWEGCGDCQRVDSKFVVFCPMHGCRKVEDIYGEFQRSYRNTDVGTA